MSHGIILLVLTSGESSMKLLLQLGSHEFAGFLDHGEEQPDPTIATQSGNLDLIGDD